MRSSSRAGGAGRSSMREAGERASRCKQKKQAGGKADEKQGGWASREVYQTHGLARAKMSPHLAFLSTAGTFRAYAAAVTVTAADDDEGAGMCAAVVGEAESMLIGALSVPLKTTQTKE